MVALFTFLLGLIVGSFLNSLVYYLEGGRPNLFGRSFCPTCHQRLAWYDLIPILSFIWLEGRCRYCQKPISPQYPLVELATAVIFTGLYFLFIQNQPQLTTYTIAVVISYYFAIAACLIVIFVFDLKHYLIPDEVVYPAVLVSSIWYLVSSIFFHAYTRYEILNTLYSAIGAALFFFLIYFFSHGRAMGFGDVKLAFLLGLFLGFPNVLVALFSAFFSGGLTGLALMFLKKKTLKSELPFAPFLVGGAFFALFFGSAAVNWYLGFLF